jgi:hypothetical protein
MRRRGNAGCVTGHTRGSFPAISIRGHFTEEVPQAVRFLYSVYGIKQRAVSGDPSMNYAPVLKKITFFTKKLEMRKILLYISCRVGTPPTLCECV